VGSREAWTKVFRCAGCGAIARVTLSQKVRGPGDIANPERVIEAVAGAFTARVVDGRTYVVRCETCGREQDHST